jgi:hypothetical protein
LSGYVRQSSADILPTAVIRATPVNNEFNALRDAFSASTGHKHDGTASEGVFVPLIADVNGYNKVVTDATNNRISVYINVSSAGSSVVPYQQQYRPQNQELYKFFPTNHTLNIKHSFTPSDRPFNLNSIVQNEPEEKLLNLRKLNESNQAFNFDEVYSETADDSSISAFYQPLTTSSKKLKH